MLFKKRKLLFFVFKVNCSSDSGISFPQNFSLDFAQVTFSYILR